MKGKKKGKHEWTERWGLEKGENNGLAKEEGNVQKSLTPGGNLESVKNTSWVHKKAKVGRLMTKWPIMRGSLARNIKFFNLSNEEEKGKKKYKS